MNVFNQNEHHINVRMCFKNYTGMLVSQLANNIFGLKLSHYELYPPIQRIAKCGEIWMESKLKMYNCRGGVLAGKLLSRQGNHF